MAQVHFIDGALHGETLDLDDDLTCFKIQQHGFCGDIQTYKIHRSVEVIGTDAKLAMGPDEPFVRYDSRDVQFLRYAGLLLYAPLLLHVEWKFGFSQSNTSGMIPISTFTPAIVWPCYFFQPGYHHLDDAKNLITQCGIVETTLRRLREGMLHRVYNHLNTIVYLDQ